MRLPSDDSRYLSRWKYVELAKFIHSSERVSRLKNADDGPLFPATDIGAFRLSNANSGLYTSIWSYDNLEIEQAVRLGSLYFDIDNENESIAHKDCVTLVQYLLKYIPEESIVVYFTGKKGFHVECEAVALGINPSNNLPHIFRFIASTLKDKLNLQSLDFAVYDARRMWRLPDSRHQLTGLYKTFIYHDLLVDNLDKIKNWASEPRFIEVSEQSFNSRANEWFREFSYNMEIEKERSKDFLAYFNKHGSTAFKQIEEKEKDFSRDKLLRNCSAVERLWEQAKKSGYLEHEARLFLCSILTYSEEAIEFLHEILSCCDDYNVEKSASHINDWIRRRQLGIGGRPYTCERANAAGVGCGACHLEERKKWIKIGDRFVETDETLPPSPVRFGYISKQKEEAYD